MLTAPAPAANDFTKPRRLTPSRASVMVVLPRLCAERRRTCQSGHSGSGFLLQGLRGIEWVNLKCEGARELCILVTILESGGAKGDLPPLGDCPAGLESFRT